ncbi:nitroreductase family protein [Actinocorallia aurea]
MTTFDATTALPLTGLELLTTTRAVRKRLDTTRPVSRDTLRECVRIALQAPAGSNNISIRYLIVDDPDLVTRLGALYQAGFDVYRSLDGIYIGSIHKEDPAEAAQQARTAASAEDLAAKMPQMPAIVIGCIEGVTRAENMPGWVSASLYASAMPALWSFMLAARLHGLGTCWTSVHLQQEKEAADLLGIPYDTTSQLMLTPVAHYTGDTFRPVTRPDPETVIHWNRWSH